VKYILADLSAMPAFISCLYCVQDANDVLHLSRCLRELILLAQIQSHLAKTSCSDMALICTF